MSSKTNRENRKVENYNFGSDFQILTLKEKREILKNAKTLLKLQRGDAVLLSGDAFITHKERET